MFWNNHNKELFKAATETPTRSPSPHLPGRREDSTQGQQEHSPVQPVSCKKRWSGKLLQLNALKWVPYSYFGVGGFSAAFCVALVVTPWLPCSTRYGQSWAGLLKQRILVIPLGLLWNRYWKALSVTLCSKGLQGHKEEVFQGPILLSSFSFQNMLKFPYHDIHSLKDC